MKKYIVAGGSTGMGLELVKDLLHEGNEVHVFSRSKPELEDTSYLIYHPWNALSDVPNLEMFEEINGLVYLPGTINLKPFHRFSLAEWQEEMQVNTFGAAIFLQQALSGLKRAKGSVVLMSTVAVQTGMPFHTSISMAKGAIEGLTRSLAAEWAPAIRVNAIAPSLTDTPLASKLLSTAEKKEASAKRHPLQRIGEVGDFSSAIRFLLDEKNTWITGQILHVDGGMGSLRVIM
jgi:3-oxoacyl-[acyl-carrier protein] reductase